MPIVTNIYYTWVYNINYLLYYLDRFLFTSENVVISFIINII